MITTSLRFIFLILAATPLIGTAASAQSLPRVSLSMTKPIWSDANKIGGEVLHWDENAVFTDSARYRDSSWLFVRALSHGVRAREVPPPKTGVLCMHLGKEGHSWITIPSEAIGRGLFITLLGCWDKNSCAIAVGHWPMAGKKPEDERSAIWICTPGQKSFERLGYVRYLSSAMELVSLKQVFDSWKLIAPVEGNELVRRVVLSSSERLMKWEYVLTDIDGIHRRFVRADLDQVFITEDSCELPHGTFRLGKYQVENGRLSELWTRNERQLGGKFQGLHHLHSVHPVTGCVIAGDFLPLLCAGSEIDVPGTSALSQRLFLAKIDKKNGEPRGGFFLPDAPVAYGWCFVSASEDGREFYQYKSANFLNQEVVGLIAIFDSDGKTDLKPIPTDWGDPRGCFRSDDGLVVISNTTIFRLSTSATILLFRLDRR